MRKSGRTAAGAQRWKCVPCAITYTFARTDQTRAATFDAFVDYVVGKRSQHEIDRTATGRSTRRRFAWCWDVVVPQPRRTGEVHRQVLVDGTYFQSWCLLVAYDGQYVIGWQWCETENKHAWGALLKQIPAPDVVVTDGGAGLRAAVDQYWTHTRIQRCYFHIFATVRRHTTLNPRLDAGKEILALTRDLMNVHDLDAAAEWMVNYARWETRWDEFLKHRTYPKKGVERPAWVRVNQHWWYTHPHLRRVRGLFRQLINDKSLFTWLDDTYLDHDQRRTVARTTSPLEGGINAGIKELLRQHRGLNQDHARRAVEWWLNSKTQFPHDPGQLARSHLTQPPSKARKPKTDNEHIGPASYDTGLTAEEGLWTRKGWAGRSH